MRLSEFIQRLEEARAFARERGTDDPQVLVRWYNGEFCSRIDVGTEQSNMALGDSDDESQVMVIRAYTILNRR